MGLACASQMHINISLINVLPSSVEKMTQPGRRYRLPPPKISDLLGQGNELQELQDLWC
jgi:hypothetical protein